MDCWCQNINTEIISTCPGPLYSMPMYEFLSRGLGICQASYKTAMTFEATQAIPSTQK